MATGLQNQTGYGRTRRPKNIAGADGTAVTDVASLAAAKVVTDASTAALKTGTGVYATENQRFLHLISTTDGTVANIWAYTYASGVWSELVDSSNASITLQANECKFVEIAGIDLLAFNLTDVTSVYAACSTF